MVSRVDIIFICVTTVGGSHSGNQEWGWRGGGRSGNLGTEYDLVLYLPDTLHPEVLILFQISIAHSISVLIFCKKVQAS